jgi:hypothetical protein
MPVELVDRLALFWWQFVASMAWVQPTIVYCVLRVMSACSILFVDLLMLHFPGFKRMCGENSNNVFLMLFMVL